LPRPIARGYPLKAEVVRAYGAADWIEKDAADSTRGVTHSTTDFKKMTEKADLFFAHDAERQAG
jgi:hypothetical protein